MIALSALLVAAAALGVILLVGRRVPQRWQVVAGATTAVLAFQLWKLGIGAGAAGIMSLMAVAVLALALAAMRRSSGRGRT